MIRACLLSLVLSLVFAGAACSQHRRLPSGESFEDIFPDDRLRRMIRLASEQDAQGARRLIEEGVGVDSIGLHGITPVWWMVWISDREGLETLLTLGFDPSMSSGEYGNPLALACSKRESEMVRILISSGADVNMRSGSDGTTPLIQAILAIDKTSVEILLEHGADIRMKSRFPELDPIRAAVMLSRFELVHLMLSSKNAPVDDELWLAEVERLVRNNHLPETSHLYVWKTKVLELLQELR